MSFVLLTLLTIQINICVKYETLGLSGSCAEAETEAQVYLGQVLGYHVPVFCIDLNYTLPPPLHPTPLPYPKLPTPHHQPPPHHHPPPHHAPYPPPTIHPPSTTHHPPTIHHHHSHPITTTPGAVIDLKHFSTHPIHLCYETKQNKEKPSTKISHQVCPFLTSVFNLYL